MPGFITKRHTNSLDPALQDVDDPEMLDADDSGMRDAEPPAKKTKEKWKAATREISLESSPLGQCNTTVDDHGL